MIRSMTGFGRAEVSGAAAVLTVEARSVNHRHLDIGLRLPAWLAALEIDVRRHIQSRLERGRVDVSVQVTPVADRSTRTVRIDQALARHYLEESRRAAAALSLEGTVTLEWLLERPGVVETVEAEAAEAATLWPMLAEALDRALDELGARREAEGAILAAELRGLHTELGAEVLRMTARAPQAAARRGERLRERLRAMLGEAPIDETRVLTEVAMWASKTDVTEELARLGAHLDEFLAMLDKGGAVGRRFDFLLQELGREVNTVGAKADDLELSQACIAAKGVLEKIREQVQNLE